MTRVPVNLNTPYGQRCEDFLHIFKAALWPRVPWPACGPILAELRAVLGRPRAQLEKDALRDEARKFRPEPLAGGPGERAAWPVSERSLRGRPGAGRAYRVPAPGQ